MITPIGIKYVDTKNHLYITCDYKYKYYTNNNANIIVLKDRNDNIMSKLSLSFYENIYWIHYDDQYLFILSIDDFYKQHTSKNKIYPIRIYDDKKLITKLCISYSDGYMAPRICVNKQYIYMLFFEWKNKLMSHINIFITNKYTCTSSFVPHSSATTIGASTNMIKVILHPKWTIYGYPILYVFDEYIMLKFSSVTIEVNNDGAFHYI